MELRGIIPPMTTPFRDSGELQLELVRGQTDWLIAAGVHGLAAGGSTGEGHALDAGETRELLAATVEAVAGRVPVIAGLIVDSTREAIKRGRLAQDLGVAALQVTPVHYLFHPDDDAMVEHFRAVTAETGLPVIIYNVLPWTYLSPALLVRVMTEVPAVIGVKQSAGDLKLLADLMVSAAPDKRIFSAVDALLYPSFTLGAHGAIAAILTAAPASCVALWDAVAAGKHGRAHDLHRRLLGLWNALSADNLPACTRFAQACQGVAAGASRAPMPAASAAQRRAIAAALEGLGIAVRPVGRAA
jgi:4-hydroxy-tetrahydrodipicolinate synthase